MYISPTNLNISCRQTVPKLSGLLAAGIDEAGRGCLAGPVTAAAVIFNDDADLSAYKDSKKLDPKQREELAVDIRSNALAWSVAHRSSSEIDKSNILAATLVAMKSAIAKLEILPELALIDGNRAPACDIPVWTIVKGDDRVPLIGAASILAKTARDAIMQKCHQRFPRYRFDTHKGYATALHKRMLGQYGPCTLHRLSFKPCRVAMNGLHALSSEAG